MTEVISPANHPPSPDWHHHTVGEVLEHFKSTDAGLSSEEAERRLAADGPNELQAGHRINPLRIIARQFKGLIIWTLIAAGVISGLLGEHVDAMAILGIVILNALIGFYQEFRAEKSIALLKKMTAPWAKVRRDGKIGSIPASRLVRGDVLFLEAGDVVAADCRLLTSASLKCIEAALTGEADAAEKHAGTMPDGDVPLGDRENMVFMGTSVAAGTAQALVVATAMENRTRPDCRAD